MKKFIATAATFIFIYPIFIRYFPLPLDRILQIFGLVLLLFNTPDLKKLISNRGFVSFLRITFILFLLALIPIFMKTGQLDFYFLKTVFDTYLNFFSAYFLFFAIRQYGGNEKPLVNLLRLIAISAVIQALVSSIFFINSGLFDIYSSILREDTNEKLFRRLTTLNKRFIGIGSQFFSGVIKYGFAFFSVLILPYISEIKWVKNRLLYGLVVSIIIVGGLLTGRTFFVALILGLVMIMILNSRSITKLISLNIKVLFATIVFLPFIYYVALITIDTSRVETITNYVFELFINLSEEGELSTTSTDATLSMYKFPESTRTWLLGDGQMLNDDNSYYMRTDVGYIRLIFYFGLPSTIIFAFILLRYQAILSRMAHSRPLKVYFFFLSVWILLLNFKGLTFDTQYFVVLLLFMTLSNPKKNETFKLRER